MCYRNAQWSDAWRGAHHHHGPNLHEWNRQRGPFAGRGRQAGPPANVEETADSYEIYLVAPGRRKEDFRLSITDDILTIASERSATDNEQRWLRNEYRIAPFERRFQLTNKVETELIRAHYEDGILHISLPKRPEFSGPAQEITVA